MSFLVAFNGQFSPHFVEVVSPGVATVSAIRPAQGVAEFKNILHQFEEGNAPRTHSQVQVYQKHTESFKQQKKREHAKDIMTSPVKVIFEKATAFEAKKLMEKLEFRHLPVVNEFNTIVGMISDREFIGIKEAVLSHEIMIQKILVCEEHTSINEIAIMLLKEKINALPIVNRKREVSGIITLTDILNYVVKSTNFLGNG